MGERKGREGGGATQLSSIENENESLHYTRHYCFKYHAMQQQVNSKRSLISTTQHHYEAIFFFLSGGFDLAVFLPGRGGKHVSSSVMANFLKHSNI